MHILPLTMDSWAWTALIGALLDFQTPGINFSMRLSSLQIEFILEYTHTTKEIE